MFDARVVDRLVGELTAVADVAARRHGNPSDLGDDAGGVVSSREDLVGVVAGLARVRAALDAVSALVVHEFDESLAWTEDGSRTAASWLRHHTSVRAGTARRELRAGSFLSRHREVARLLAGGEITFDHVTALERVDLPRVREVFDVHLDELLVHARNLGADEFADVCRQWLALADQDGPGDRERRRFERRRLHVSQMFDGNFRLDAVLPDRVGAGFADAIARFAQELWEGEQAAAAVDPALSHEFTPAQRRADAFALLVGRGLGVDTGVAGTVAARTSLSVIVDEDTLHAGRPGVTESGHWLSGASVNECACDSVVYGITVDQQSIPINLGRTVRLATPAQRRVVIARDRVCVWKGCCALPAWCKFHHIVPWDDGGLTDVDNLCLLCDHHHTLVHHGGWTLRRDRATGDIVITGPHGADPPRRRCRGTTERQRIAAGLADPRTRHHITLARQRTLALTST
jgi:hypothetical protein